MLVHQSLRKYNSYVKRIFYSFFISNVGNASVRVVLPVIIYELTGSKMTLAASFLVSRLPSMFLGNPLGNFCEKFDPRTLMIILDAVGIALFCFIAFFYKAWGMGFVLFTFFVSYTLMFMFQATKTKLTTKLVQNSEEINEIVAMRLQVIYVTLAIGPFISGYLIKWFSVNLVLLLNSATFLISILFLYKVPVIGTNSNILDAIKSSFAIRTGFGFFSNLKTISNIAILKQASVLYFIRSVAYGIVNALVPVIALDRLGIGSEGLGNYFLLGMIGAVSGTYIYAKYVKLKIPAYGNLQNYYILAASILEILFLFLHLYTSEPVLFIVCAMISTIFMLLIESRIEYIFADYAPTDEKASIRSFQEVIKSTAFCIGIVISIFVVKYFNYHQIAFMVTTIMLCSLFSLFLKTYKS